MMFVFCKKRPMELARPEIVVCDYLCSPKEALCMLLLLIRHPEKAHPGSRAPLLDRPRWPSFQEGTTKPSESELSKGHKRASSAHLSLHTEAQNDSEPQQKIASLAEGADADVRFSVLVRALARKIRPFLSKSKHAIYPLRLSSCTSVSIVTRATVLRCHQASSPLATKILVKPSPTRPATM